MNPILETDAYSISSDGFVPLHAQRYSCYNFTNRRSATVAYPNVAMDSRMVLFGVRHFVENQLTKPVTLAHVREAELFLNDFHSFGGPVYFPKALWTRVATDCGGYLPIKVSALKDGSTFFPYEPPIQVEGEDGFGELAAHIEARLVGAVSKATACATLCRHWRDRIELEVEKDLNILGRKYTRKDVLDVARWVIHNFGSRACINGDESVLLGMAHLLSFNGTDNTDAAFQARSQGASPPVATSIMALAHRNIQAWNNERVTFNAISALEKQTRGNRFKIVANVADCYDFTVGLERVSDMAVGDNTTTYVCRPDSGDGKAQILQICHKAKSLGLYKEENGLFLPTNLRFIYGDSVSPEYMFEIMDALRTDGFPPTMWGIFGVGGYLVNHSTRDTFSSSFKLAETFDGPRVKLSNTPAKMSVPYKTKIVTNLPKGSPRVHINGDDAKVVVYDKGITNVNWNFDQIIKDSDNEFVNSKPLTKDWGMNRESLCNQIKEYQDIELSKRGPKNN